LYIFSFHLCLLHHEAKESQYDPIGNPENEVMKEV
jgi:hypothetical protein